MLLACDKNWKYSPTPALPACPYSGSARLSTRARLKTGILKYKKNIQIMRRTGAMKRTPWFSIITDLNFLLAMIQSTAQSWGTQVMTLMLKKYLEEIHGYSIREAAIMVTIPVNIAQIALGWAFACLGDFALKKHVPKGRIPVGKNVLMWLEI